jgi:hypothetical protein
MKSPRYAKFRLLQPLELLYSPWKSTLIDFIITLLESEGLTQIMVVVDRFLKMAHFIALAKTATTKDAAQAFMKQVWKLHGLPESIISDQDTIWTIEFWEGVYSLLGIKKRMSTVCHPQTERQMERVNQTLETYLRTFINYNQDDWYSLLPLVEFAYNNPITQVTQLTPFYTNYWFHSKAI